MKKVVALDKEYELIKNYKNSFNNDEFTNLVTEYFIEYDYILGDYSYNKLRLKGLCDKDNEKFNKINDYSTVENYIKNNCAYDCGYFILRKIK